MNDDSPPEVGAWYRPGPSIQEFHEALDFVRVLVGARGAGKTSAVAVETVRHCWQNAGAKVMLVRKTETSQADSTIDTFLQVFDKMGNLYVDTQDGLFRSWNNGVTMRLPSAKAVEAFNKALPTFKTKADRVTWLDTEGNRLCSFVEMRGLPHKSAAESKLRGFECSLMILVEADQIAKRDFNLAMACVRWKGADPATCDENGYILDRGVILDTNPPGTDHWIAEMEEDEKKNPESKMRFWHIPTEENIHNLPQDYIETQIMIPYRKNPAMIERMLYGRYADAYDGNAVYYAFDPVDHVGEDLPWPNGAMLIRGWDFGTHNSVVWSAYWIKNNTEYWHDLAEQFLESSDTERQAREALKLTERDFPFWNDRSICGGLFDYCDPAGKNSSYLTSDKKLRDPIAVLNTYGIFPGYKTAQSERGLQVSIALVNRLLEKRDDKDRPCYRVDKKNCPILYRGYIGGYRYPNSGEAGYGNNEPLKGVLCNHLDHIQDSARYSKINALKLLKAEHEAKKQSNLAARYENPNPRKRI